MSGDALGRWKLAPAFQPRSGRFHVQVFVGQYTYQLESVGSLTSLQVLGDVPVRCPGRYNGEADPSSRRDIRNLKDGNQVRM